MFKPSKGPPERSIFKMSKFLALVVVLGSAFAFQGVEGDQALILMALPATAALTFLALG